VFSIRLAPLFDEGGGRSPEGEKMIVLHKFFLENRKCLAEIALAKAGGWWYDTIAKNVEHMGLERDF